MPKNILLIISLVLLILVSTFVGIWRISYTTLEGATTLQETEKTSSKKTDTNATDSTTPSVATISGPAITPAIDLSNIAIKTKYNSDNLDVEYHDDPQKTGSNNIYNTEMGKAQVYDVNGNLVDVVSNAVQGNIVYYQPGSYKYGATSYVPYYEDSVFLSRSINSIVNKPTYITSNVGGGFCNKYKADPIQIEQKCNSINNETCAATTCCVLLGGQKCVAGGENGPTMKDNYSDFMVTNKDFYYYQGKCYGNCPNTPQFPFPTLPEKLPYMPAAPGPVPGPVPPIPIGTQMPPLISYIPPPPPSAYAQ